MAPLPPIPETIKHSTSPNLWSKIARRVRSRTDLFEFGPRTVSDNSPGKTEAPSHCPDFNSRPSLRPHISSPELMPARDSLSAAEYPLEACGGLCEQERPPSFANQYSSLTSGSSKACGSTPQVTYGLEPPRLSPMEYTRMYLLEEAKSISGSQKCELPAPRKLWFWTPKWDSFLIVPAIPPEINRQPVVQAQDSASPQVTNISVSPRVYRDLREMERGCPRLSLNLGSFNSFLPSLMDLASLGNDGDSTEEHTADAQDNNRDRGCARWESKSERAVATLNTVPDREWDSGDINSCTTKQEHAAGASGGRQNCSTPPTDHGDDSDNREHGELSLHSQNDCTATAGNNDCEDASRSMYAISQESGTRITCAHSRPQHQELNCPDTNCEDSEAFITLAEGAYKKSFRAPQRSPQDIHQSILIDHNVPSTGGQLHPGDCRDTRLGALESMRSMISEFQPSPLRLGRHFPRTDKDDNSSVSPTGSTRSSICETVIVRNRSEPLSEMGPLIPPPRRRRASTNTHRGNNASPSEVLDNSPYYMRDGSSSPMSQEPQNSPTIRDYFPCRSPSHSSALSSNGTSRHAAYVNRRPSVFKTKDEAFLNEYPGPPSMRPLLDPSEDDEPGRWPPGCFEDESDPVNLVPPLSPSKDDEPYRHPPGCFEDESDPLSPLPPLILADGEEYRDRELRLLQFLATMRECHPDHSSFTLEPTTSSEALDTLPSSGGRSVSNNPARDDEQTAPIDPTHPRHIPIIVGPPSPSLRPATATQERRWQHRPQSDKETAPQSQERRPISSALAAFFHRKAHPKNARTPSAPWRLFRGPAKETSTPAGSEEGRRDGSANMRATKSPEHPEPLHSTRPPSEAASTGGKKPWGLRVETPMNRLRKVRSTDLLRTPASGIDLRASFWKRSRGETPGRDGGQG